MSKEKYNFTYTDVHIALENTFPLDMIEWKVSQDPISDLHHHDCYEVGLCLEGFGLYVLGGKVYTYQKGDVVVVGPKVYHRAHTESVENDLWTFIFFSPSDWSTIMLEEDISLILCEQKNILLHDLVMQAYLEIKDQKKDSKNIAGACMSVVVPLISRAASEHTSNKIQKSVDIDYRVQKAMNLLMDSANINLSIAELAEKCNISVSYFRELFKSQVGISPKEFQLDVRLKRAQSLIRGTDLRMVDISLECGFNNISSFNRQFLEKFKITPYQMKKLKM